MKVEISSRIMSYSLVCIILIGMFGCAEFTGRSAGTHVDDSIIESEISIDFLREKNLKSGGISAKSINGVVILSGVVENKDQEIIAKYIAGKVKGVKEVRSNLEIQKRD